MGEFAKKLHKHAQSKADRLPTKEPERRPGELLPGGIKDVKMLIQEGLDPIHAAYTFMQSFTAHFADCVFHFPEMKPWAKVVAKAEDEYSIILHIKLGTTFNRDVGQRNRRAAVHGYCATLDRGRVGH